LFGRGNIIADWNEKKDREVERALENRVLSVTQPNGVITE